MNATGRRFVFALACAILAASVAGSGARAEAMGQGPTLPPCTDTSRVFWFVHASDLHIGTSGSTDNSRLTWLVTTGRSVIQPLFTVVTGDLTDSTNGNLFGYPNGPYLSEWQEYRGILDRAGVTALAEDYYDIPGNHDAYNDATFAYFTTWGLQGPTYGATGQVAWSKTLPWGKYHFVAVNTADNRGTPFSITSPYGDRAGLDATELGALNADLAAEAATANLSFVFGHHPVTSTGNSSDTYLYYGAPEFVTALGNNRVLAYSYGHAHDNVETIFKGASNTGTVPGSGLRYRRVASLGKTTSGDLYSVVSVDCNGVNTVTQPAGTWPLVLITAPVGRYAGSVENPYDYDVEAGTATSIRALVFDAATVQKVQFRVDGGMTWYAMTRTAGTPKWWGTWNSSTVPTGEHTIEVQATGTTIRSHSVKVNVINSNPPPPPPPPATDTVTITTATYTRKTSTLLVKATSTSAPTAVLTVQGYTDPMVYSAKTKTYSFQRNAASAPLSVTVTSSQGGSANKAVTVK